MKPIYILCLAGVRTGGPEAIHQLSDALIEQGFDARMVYYDWAQIAALEAAQPQEGYMFGSVHKNEIEEYARYKVNQSDVIWNREDTIIVLPETLCHLAPKFDKATVLVWWLSVDNGFGALAKVNLNHLRAENVKHAYQSRYAQQFLASLGLDSYHLSDYTTDISKLAKPMPTDERANLVLFNANHKVTTDLQLIADQLGRADPSIECIPIRGLDRKEVAALFARARVYVDLGNLPGKDRMPREASLMGCDVLVASNGAGATDFPFANVLNPAEAAAPNIYIMSECYGGAVRAINPDKERSDFFKEAGALFGLIGA